MLIWTIAVVLTIIYLLNIVSQIVVAVKAKSAREASIGWIYAITNTLVLAGILYLVHAAVNGVG